MVASSIFIPCSLLPPPSSGHSSLACLSDSARLGNPNYYNIIGGLNAVQSICRRQGMRVSNLEIQNNLNLHLPAALSQLLTD